MRVSHSVDAEPVDECAERSAPPNFARTVGNEPAQLQLGKTFAECVEGCGSLLGCKCAQAALLLDPTQARCQCRPCFICRDPDDIAVFRRDVDSLNSDAQERRMIQGQLAKRLHAAFNEVRRRVFGHRHRPTRRTLRLTRG